MRSMKLSNACPLPSMLMAMPFCFSRPVKVYDVNRASRLELKISGVPKFRHAPFGASTQKSTSMVFDSL